MYTDDIKLFARNEKELETLIHTVRIYSHDIGMEFWPRKMYHAHQKKWQMTYADGMELRNYDKIRTLGENETYKYLCILEADTIKQVEMKDKIQNEYLSRTRKLLETILSSRNFIKEKLLGLCPSLDIRDPFSSGLEMNLNKWIKEQEN